MRSKLFILFEIFGYFVLLFLIAGFLLWLNMEWIMDLFPSSRQNAFKGWDGLGLLFFGSLILGLLLTIPSYYYLRRYRKLSLAIAITGFIPAFLILSWILRFYLSNLAHLLFPSWY